MNENSLEILYEAIMQGMEFNPCLYKLYQMLGKYYVLKGNFKQAYISLRQAKFYCDNPTDSSEIDKTISEVISMGGEVPKTSVVILSWNLKDYTVQCINSIRQTTLREDVQIIVVDNASDDGSVDWLKEQDDILLKINEKNEGFPKGCNQGIALAQADTDIFLLNNDTVLPPNALFWLKIGLYENDKVGSTGAMSNYVSNDQMVDQEFMAPGEVLDYAMQHNIPMYHPYEPKIYLVGFALLMKRTVLDEIGLLDERFSPGNCEDIDIGIRMRMAGYENMLCKNSVILHFGSQSFDKLGDDFKNIMLKNIDKLNEKYGHNMRNYLLPQKELTNHLNIEDGKSVNILEVGCGAGATLAWIRGKYPKATVYGIDKLNDLVSIASSVGNVVCADVEHTDLQYEKETFDYIIMGRVIQNLNEPGDVLRRLLVYLKNNGSIILSIPDNKLWFEKCSLLLDDESNDGDRDANSLKSIMIYKKEELSAALVSDGRIV